MLKVGLTGGIGSGKSTVGRILRLLGVPLFAADEAGRALLANDPEVHTALRNRFGDTVLVHGVPDRKALAKHCHTVISQRYRRLMRGEA